ncbi:hypothetical protein BX266_7434 [Streptomyces sp. TLI_171]|nr:hypothetical protein BX266_7434 [Streptomyces sp. TLI_171]
MIRFFDHSEAARLESTTGCRRGAPRRRPHALATTFTTTTVRADESVVDLIRRTRAYCPVLLVTVNWSEKAPADRFAPQPTFPAPQGLLRWGSSEQEIELVWRTGAADPSDWPVLVRDDVTSEWQQFDCGVGEFLARLLTDVALGFPSSYLLDERSFESWDR